MLLPPDFHDLLSEFNAAGVDYLLIGSYALALYGMPRYTLDIDIFFRRTPDNAAKVISALKAFGFSSPDLSAESLIDPDQVHYIGNPPLRVDLLGDISGVTFADAWGTREIKRVDGLQIQVISLECLRRNKRAAGRLKDLADLEQIEKTLQQR